MNELLLAVPTIISAIALFKIYTLQQTILNLKQDNQNLFSQIGQLLMQSQKNATDALSSSIENLTKTVDQRLFFLSQDNAQKLEKIRQTVDEKLHESLEKRLGESFKIVSERLEQVFKGLGEMQNLATGVGDLKKVLTNVKTRGIWGEVQLEAILDQLMHPSQYDKNVATKPDSDARVEFAVKIPCRDGQGSHIWLPVDSKFPLENYQRIISASELGDVQAIAQETKNLELFVKSQAKSIAEKYIDPQTTTDFAIMFLPIEGLYAEILRIPGLMEHIQSHYRILITSPTTISAILSSLQLGFKTIAIEQRSHEVRKVLGLVKSEFIKFTDILSKTKVKLDQASRIIGDVETRTRVMQKKLTGVELVDQEISVNSNLPLSNEEDAA